MSECADFSRKSPNLLGRFVIVHFRAQLRSVGRHGESAAGDTSVGPQTASAAMQRPQFHRTNEIVQVELIFGFLSKGKASPSGFDFLWG